MNQNPNFSFSFPAKSWRELRRFLENQGVELKETPKGIQARFEDTVISWFNTGKLLLQGKGASDFAEELYVRGWLKTRLSGKQEPRIGVDEAGKGDYFGPLVVAGALVAPEQEHILVRLGVRDSKTISLNLVQKLAKELETILVHSKVVINPLRYNQLHQGMGNVNRIMGWAHARVIENVLENHSVKLAISDQFGDEEYIKEALLERGKKIHLIQKPGGEKDLAVASASIIARGEFLNRLEGLSKKAGILLPRGAGEEVIEAGRQLLKKLGREGLEEFAKIHFQTSKKIWGDG